MRGRLRGRFGILRGRRGKTVGLVKTRRLAAMQKQQRAKAGMKQPVGKKAAWKGNGSFPLRNGSSSRDPK